MKTNTKDIAQGIYTANRNLTQEEVAERVGITPKTLRKWIKDGQWDTMRDYKAVTKPELLKAALSQLAALNDQIAKNGNVPNKVQSDALATLGKLINSLSEVKIVEKVEAYQALTQYLYSQGLAKEAVLVGEFSAQYLKSL
jgi:transcriptional regulator with XRE-family HTH domain